MNDRRRRLTIKQRDSIAGYLFILPWIAGFMLFTAYPFFYSIFISLSSVRITPHGILTDWIGLQNYFDIFTKDINFIPALTDSIIFIVISTPLIIIVSLILALLLNGNFKGRSIFRAIFFLPVVIMSGPVISELVSNKAAEILDPQKYVIYNFFATLPGNIGMPITYVFNNLVIILWFSGVQILIFLAWLQKIDFSIYEAAQIDGASAWEIFWKITLPFIKPSILVNAIYTIVELASFPTNKINIDIASKMFETGHVYSYSSAMSWVYFLIEALLLAIVFLILREKQE